ncbi:FecR family protein, partial [candidate division KSB1 bacterium]
AAVLAVAAVGILGVKLVDYLRKPHLIEAITAANEIKEIILDDGSRVLLNSDSRIEYNNYFPENSIRFVHVWGEAFFDVIKEPRSFIVVTENATVKAFGTSFSVRYRDEETRVIVKTGSVGFKAKSLPAWAGMILVKGEMLTYKDEKKLNPAKRVDPDQYLDWVENKIIFDETSLSDVVTDLKERFNVEIELSDASLGSESITGSFHQQPVEDIISSICLTLNITYKVENGKYIISR